MANKEIAGRLKLRIEVGKANPSPPLGPALGGRGINIMEFCKQFNATKFDFQSGTPVSTVIDFYKDKTFVFHTKGPTVSYLIKQKLGIKKGSNEPGKEIISEITQSQIESVAKEKMLYTNADSLDSVMKMVVGSAKSMGISMSDTSETDLSETDVSEN